MVNLPRVLKQLGYPSMRTGQDRVVACVMAGRDTVGILPTGMGKTDCFTIPILACGLKALVFSPLISLMRDQLQSAVRKGVRVGSITSHDPNMGVEFMKQWLRGDLDLLFVAPERLRRDDFLDIMRKVPPDLVVLDECFTPETEILTARGFVRFDALLESDKCAQFDTTDSGITFVKPDAVICKPFEGDLIRMHGDKSCDLTMTPGHELLLQTKDGWKKQAVKDVSFNWLKRMYTAGVGKSCCSAVLTIQERFMIALQADGSIHNQLIDGSSGFAFTFSKQRKIDRFIQLMTDGSFDWSEVKRTGRSGVRRFLVRGLRGATKFLPDHFKLEEMSADKARDFIAEVVEWDGSKISGDMHYYSSSEEANTDFVQAVCVLAGYRSNKVLQKDDRKASYKNMHRLFISLNRSWIGTQGLAKDSVAYKGNVHCVRVPTGNIIVRGKGKPVVIGNCHCLSTWSMTFRPAYKVIGDFITEFKPRQLLALTATCPPQVEQDVRHVMCMDDAHKEVYFPRRNNLVLKSELWTSAAPLLTLLERVTEGAAIVYCATRAQVEKTAKEIQDMSGREVGFYHGGMTPSQRSHAQDRFMSGETPWVVATNAFGMGVDKSNVRLVVHRDIPGSIEALSQEIGRGGRDGKQTLCQTYFSQDSVRTHHFLINLSSPSFDEVKQVYKALHQLVDRNSGVVNATNDEVANTAGLKTYKLGAIMSILSGARVIDKAKADEKICSIKLRNRVDDARLTSLLEVLHECGHPADDGYTEISMAVLSDELGVSDTTVKKRLVDMSKSQMIEYVPPEKSKPIKLIGDINQVDARTVDELRSVAFAKLDQVIAYARDIPDVDKHRYIEDMLGITSC